MMQRLTLLSVILLSAAVVSCTRDVRTDIPGPGTRTEEAEVTFTLQMPASYGTATATVDENFVKTAYILAFKAGDGIADGSEVYDYSALAYAVADAGDSRYKTVSVTLLKKDYPQKLVLITNAKPAVEALNLQPGVKTKNEVLEMLEFGRSDEWHSEMNEFIPIPMWGETKDAVTINDNTTRIGTLVLTRMISRLDVVKDPTITDEQFKITSVHLYNRLTNGRVAPSRAATHWDDSDYKAIHPTIPSANSHKVKGPLAVNAVQSGATMIAPTIYAFEAEAPDDAAAANATCLVIGGIYDESGSESFYRVDFVDKDDGGKVTGYKHLLRNHIYRINISDVYGSGHPTPDEAFDSKAVNMDADVKEWDEGSITEVVFDKDYMLGVSQTEYKLPKNKTTRNLLVVTTDVPAGWEITKVPSDADWITITSSTTGPADEKSEVYFDLEENSGAERTATFKVTAGRLSIIVKIIQGIEEKYNLELLDDITMQPVESILFTTYGDDLVSSASPAKTLIANWTPTSEACMVSYYTTGTYGLGFNSRTNPFTAEAMLYGGQKLYSVHPDDFTTLELSPEPFMEKSARANLVVGEGSDAVLRTLKMRQVHYDLFAQPEDTYDLKGETKSFTLRTNGSWTVAVTAGNSKLATLAKTSGDPVPSGEEFYFTLANDPDGNIADRSMTLTFTYTGEDNRSATKTVIINAAPARGIKDAGDANSYILEPDGEGVLIPLSWANGSTYGELIKANDNVTVKVLWIDSDRGIAPNSVISGYKLKGNGSSGKIEVYPGSQEGNALIAAIVDNEIKWSWHIWVTGYDIDGTTFKTTDHTWMHINLGALNNTPGNVNSYGLFYQLGRKDPFPTVVSLSNASQRPLWDETGQNRVYMNVEATTQADNIRHAMKTPTTFYKGVPGNNSDWITSNNSVKDDYLWNSASNKKTHYDPCPAGWRTPYAGSSGPFVALGFTSSFENNSGRRFAGSNSYWPMVGRISTTGVYDVSASSLTGYYWSGAVESIGNLSGRYLLMRTSGAELYGSLERSNAMNVRCVKE